MSTAEGWMRDALELADEVLEAGEGELVGMADFGDVEFMVCPLYSHFPSLCATRQDVLFSVLETRPSALSARRLLADRYTSSILPRSTPIYTSINQIPRWNLYFPT